MRSRYYVAGQEVQWPLNHFGLKFRLDVDQETQSKSFSGTALEWGVSDARDTRDAFTILRNIVNKGLSGGVGLTEGVPLQIVFDSEHGDKTELFNGYINLWDSEFDTGKITAPIKQGMAMDWLNEKADSFSFAYLEEIGIISEANYVTIPYCIEKKQNAIEMIMLTCSIFVITDKLIGEIKELAKLLADTANPFTTFSGTAKILAEVVYIIVLLIALISLLVSLFENIIQRVKYHYGMKVVDMMEAGCKHLGLTFRSSIFQNTVYKDLILLPEKYQVATNTGILASVEGLVKDNKKGQKGYYIGTFGNFLRAFKDMFKAKLVIEDGVLYFEKYNFRKNRSGITIPELWDAKSKFKFNYSDFKSNYELEFSIDQSDRHTIKEYDGTYVQVFQKQKAVKDASKVLTTGHVRTIIPFALGKKKTALSNTEKVLKGFFEIIQPPINLMIDITNEIIALINEILSFLRKVVKILNSIGIKIKLKIKDIPRISRLDMANQIQNRIGMLKMESDYVNVPKLLFLSNGKIANQEYLNARKLFEEYHAYGLFVANGSNPPSQYLIKKADGIPFSYTDFKTLLKDVTIFTAEGEGEIISVEFDLEGQTADFEYKILKQYTTNIELKYI